MVKYLRYVFIYPPFPYAFCKSVKKHSVTIKNKSSSGISSPEFVKLKTMNGENKFIGAESNFLGAVVCPGKVRYYVHNA